MKSETLQLSRALDESSALAIAQILNALNGVSKVAITTTTSAVDISFDENITSMQELRTALKKSGFGTKSIVHGEEGMCCGSCGG